MSEFDGKVAVITGGSTGIGRAAARRLARAGAAVVFCGHDEGDVERTVEELWGEGLEVDGLRADVSAEGEMEALVWRTVERHSGIDVLVCSAGAAKRKKPPPPARRAKK